MLVSRSSSKEQCGCADYITSSYPDRTPPLNNRLTVHRLSSCSPYQSAHQLLLSCPSSLTLSHTMFPKIVAFGIGALALVQGALAIADGRYYINNLEYGSLVGPRRGGRVRLSRTRAEPVSSRMLYTTPLPTFSPVDRGTKWTGRILDNRRRRGCVCL
jgi:hypothetical protein